MTMQTPLKDKIAHQQATIAEYERRHEGCATSAARK